MADRNKTMARIVFLNGRIDACERMVDGLQARIQAERDLIVKLKGEITDDATRPTEASQ